MSGSSRILGNHQPSLANLSCFCYQKKDEKNGWNEQIDTQKTRIWGKLLVVRFSIPCSQEARCHKGSLLWPCRSSLAKLGSLPMAQLPLVGLTSGQVEVVNHPSWWIFCIKNSSHIYVELEKHRNFSIGAMVPSTFYSLHWWLNGGSSTTRSTKISEVSCRNASFVKRMPKKGRIKTPIHKIWPTKKDTMFISTETTFSQAAWARLPAGRGPNALKDLKWWTQTGNFVLVLGFKISLGFKTLIFDNPRTQQPKTIAASKPKRATRFLFRCPDVSSGTGGDLLSPLPLSPWGSQDVTRWCPQNPEMYGKNGHCDPSLPDWINNNFYSNEQWRNMALDFWRLDCLLKPALGTPKKVKCLLCSRRLLRFGTCQSNWHIVIQLAVPHASYEAAESCSFIVRSQRYCVKQQNALMMLLFPEQQSCAWWWFTFPNETTLINQDFNFLGPMFQLVNAETWTSIATIPHTSIVDLKDALALCGAWLLSSSDWQWIKNRWHVCHCDFCRVIESHGVCVESESNKNNNLIIKKF